MAQPSGSRPSKWGSSLTDVFNRFLEELFEHPLAGNKQAPSHGPKDIDDETINPKHEPLNESQRVRCEVLDFTMKSDEGTGGKGRLYVDYIIRVQFNPDLVRPVDDIAGCPEPAIEDVAELPISGSDALEGIQSSPQRSMVIRNHIFIARRYQQFHDLHDGLRKTFSGKLPILPPRTFIGDAMAVDVIESRKNQLQGYLRVLTSHPEWWCEPLAAFCGVKNAVDAPVATSSKVAVQIQEQEIPAPSPAVPQQDADVSSASDDDHPPVRQLDPEEIAEQERVQDSMFEL